MRSLYEILSTPGISIAVVGATDHAYKYGSVIYRQLKTQGFRVFPVNPSRGSVDGDVCYPSVSALPVSPDIINFVTPSDITFQVLAECRKQKWMNVWIQPGAEDQKVIDYLQVNGFNYLVNTCIMVHAAYTKNQL